ncbi:MULTISPECIES: methyl-accepting chemotaxis protein [unclassified Fusibacter]|uniref:methyl-accepting chemotaxis protein n=1 Tax=unclassified Fusibacter TaxID=2624464 RepID=UPI00101187B1|nr:MULTISPECIES: methyl-accepting chemotaxis protein [unclassified Fusibacter]MCK8058123.1 methyl-accepting chemotaxis protein [Fusibacter sp. A2]NPE20705.1 methyl-accepting chemotaxis protein [Fusibacter sp. A1]RXV62910.1 methyl-accepting chemotaxis protein [Fusibacter sp. A1]
MEKQTKSYRANETKVRFSISNQLMLFFSLIIVFVLLAVGLRSYISAEKIIKDNLVSNSQALNLEISNELQYYLGKYELVVSYLASDANVKNVNDDTDKIWMLNVFKGFIAQDPDIMYAYVGSSTGKMYMIPDEALPAGYDPRTRPWYTDAVEADALVWTPPYADASSGEVVVTVAKPVKSDTGKLLGVVALDLRLNTLAEKIHNVKIGKSGAVYMVDNVGNIIVHPDETLVGQPMPVAEIYDAMQKNDEAVVNYKYKNSEGKSEDKFTTFATIPGVNWKIGAAFSVKAEIIDDSRNILINIIVIGLIALVVSIVLSYFYARSIKGSIQKIVAVLGKMRTGDMSSTLSIKSKDEFGLLGQYFNDTTKALSHLISDIQVVSDNLSESASSLAATAEQTSASADEVSKAIDDIAKGANNQSGEAEQSVVLAQSLSTKFEKLNTNVKDMMEQAKEVMSSNNLGFKTLDGLKAKTLMSTESNLKIEEVISSLNEKTTQIGGILDSISAISVQTNLLALNASIEAARAGEHGRGFAVVAEEIRKLAEESSRSADEVRVIVTNIQEDSVKSVKSMNEMKVISNEQTAAVADVAKSFDSISTSIDGIANQIDHISSYMVEVIHDKNNITSSILNISSVSEETAAASEEVTASMQQQSEAVEEVAKAAEILNEIAINLNNELSKFTI